MTGLDKIVNQILEEANKTAGEKIAEAKKQAEEIKQQAQAEADKLAEEISRKSETDVANNKDRVVSSIDLKKRTAVLEAKQEVINGTIEKAYEKFCSQSGDEYYGTLAKMLEKFAQPQEGTIYFSKEDLESMPKAFTEKIQEIAKAKGGTLTVSPEGRAMKGGFILAYGGIEENCSFKSLFDSKRDELQDKVQKLLFS